jgi:hypothetical protein
MTDGLVDPPATQLVPTTLPGLGNTYLDQSMVPKVNEFIANAAAHGVNLHFNSAYRTPEHQAALHNDPNAITPADNSLHSAGFAVDVNYSSLPANQRQIIRDAATAAGLQWGGDFRSADPPHFYADPPVDRGTAIANATRQYGELTAPQVTQPAATANPPAAAHDAAPPQAQPPATGSPAASPAPAGSSSQAIPGLNDPSHPGHAMFRQAQTQVYALDTQHGRLPDQRSDNPAGALAVASKADGLNRIDAVAVSHDGSRTHAAQHAVPGALTASTSVPTLEAMNTPLDKSSAAWNQVAQQQVQAQSQMQTQTQAQTPSAPSSMQRS